MFHNVNHAHLWKILHRGLSFFLIFMVMLGTLPWGIAQAENITEAEPAQLSGGQPQEYQPPPSYTEPNRPYESPEYSPFVQQTTTSSSPAPFNGMDVFEPVEGMTPSGDLLVTGSSGTGGSLSGGTNLRSQPAGGINLHSLPAEMITVDLTYDTVMGWVSPGATVEVTVATDGYGMAVADDVGFFWTPVWDNTAGYYYDVNCGMTISISVNGAAPVVINAPCLDSSINLQTNTVNGDIEEVPFGTPVTATLGSFDIWSGGGAPAPSAPSVSGSTASFGEFSLDFSTIDINLGAESLVALDRVVDGANIRSYAYPEPSVFMVQQYNTIAGYAPIGQQVAATVFADDTKVNIVWEGFTTANAPHGYYLFENVEMTIGNFIEVGPPGGPFMETTVIELGNFDFVTTSGWLAGTAPVDASVRASLWQWAGEERLYKQAQATAVSGNSFSMDLSSIGLKARDDVLVAVADADGNQVQLLSGMPFVNAWQDLRSDIDCVVGRLDGPGLPIHTRLEKTGEEPYTRDTGTYSDAGNSIVYCFVMRDASNNFVNFSPGDMVTLHSGGVSPWAGTVTIVPMSWSGDTALNSISGTLPAGDLEVAVVQWNGWAYPLHGWANRQITHGVSGGFTASFGSFDVRDGNLVYLSHFDPITGYGNHTHNWIETENLAFFELYPPYGVGGKVDSPGAGVTAVLYDMDGVTELARTSDDRDDHPYWFWLDDFGGYALQPGYRVEVSTTTGWQADMVIPALAIDGDVTTDTITASGPEDLLFIEVSDQESWLGLFAPGPVITLNTMNYGYDLQPSASIALTYQAPDGNRARVETRLADISMVGFWLNPGTDDWMWGDAKPGKEVTAFKEVGSEWSKLFTTFADPACGGCWEIDNPVEINPGDVIKVATDVDEFGVGDYEVTFTVPSPLEASVDTQNNIVSGQVGGRSEDWVQVHGWWDNGFVETTTDAAGNFSVDYSAMGVDVPGGAEGYIRFVNWEDLTEVRYNQVFRSMDLVFDINYSHNWIEGNYAPGYPITLEVYGSDYKSETAIPKATASGVTAEIPWWGGGTGFSTNYNLTWDPEHPNIQPYDWVVGQIVIDEETTYNAEVQIGLITGEVDLVANSITGTVDAPWLPQDVPVEVQCHAWGAPEWTEGKSYSVLPDGIDTYTCAWDPDWEWDIQPGQDIGVFYRDPDGHNIFSAHMGYSDEPIMMIHYDHDWIQGNYKPGHQVYLEVRDGDDNFKASTTLETQVFDDWGWSGFATHREGTVWSPQHPDLQPGDTVRAEVDGGTEFWADVEIGLVTAEADYLNNRVSGTVDASWLMPGPVDVGCYTWEDNGRNVYTTVVPDGTSEYTCEFAGDNYFDLDQGSNLMVAYFEPDGHELIGEFRAPTPHLRIDKWYMGGGSPGAGSNAEFSINYGNQGNGAAEVVIITDTMDGFAYLSDTSGVVPTVIDNIDGTQEVTWSLGTVEPGDWIGFQVFVAVTANIGDPVSNVVVISTSNIYDQGDEWEKRSEWEGWVAANSTDLNVGINPWTWHPAPGQEFIYGVGICNNGETSSQPVTLTVNLDDLIFSTDTWMIRSDSEAGWVLTSRSDHQLVLTRPTVSGWHCHELYFLVTLGASALPGDELHSTASVITANEVHPDDNFAEVTHHVGEPYMDLGLWQDWHGGSLVPGGHYRYGINYQNHGNLAVSGPVQITATLPEGTTFRGWESWGWGEVSYVGTVGNVVTWTVSGLKAGYSGTIAVDVTINSTTAVGTTLLHGAVIDIADDDANNNTHEFSETVNEPGPNLRISKWGGWHGHGEGHNAWYGLQVENIGTETIYDVVITDDYDAKMELEWGLNVNFWEWWDWDHDDVNNIITVTLARLEPGWNVHINYDMFIPGELTPGMAFVNTAAVPLVGDINPDDNSVDVELISEHGPAPHLQIEHWLIGDGSPGEGGNAAFWVQFRNQGDALAENVTITDTMVGMTYLRDTSDGITAAQPGDTEVTWTFGDLEPGDWIGFVVYGEVTATIDEPYYSNTVTIETDSLYDRGDESEKTSTWEGNVAANDTYLNVGKWPWTEHPAPGQDYVYTINVCNYGTTSSSTVTMTDTLPGLTSFVDWWSWDGGWAWGGQSGQDITLTHTSISPNTCSEVYIRVHLSESANIDDGLTNIAEISGGNDLSPDDNRTEAQHSVGGAHTDLAIWNGLIWGTLTPGGHYSYHINFQNQGNTAVAGPVTITATLPAGTSYAEAHIWGMVEAEFIEVTETHVVWHVSGLDAGYSGTIDLTLDIDDNDDLIGTALDNTVTIDIVDDNPDNNTHTFTEFVYGHGPNLRIFKWGGWHGHGDGHNAWYSLRVENVGDETIDNVVITDTYDADMEVEWVHWDESSWVDYPTENYFTISLGSLEPSWRVDINYDMVIPETVTLTPGMVFANTASVTPTDGYPEDNSATVLLVTDVQPEESPPAFTSFSFATFVVGVPGSFTVTTNGYPPPEINQITGSLPDNVTLTDNGNGTATIAGTPAAGSEGQYVITLTASNGIGDPAEQTFTLTVGTETGSAGEDGGDVSFEEGDIVMEVPADALGGETEFIYVQQTDPSQDPIENFSFAGISFQLTAIDIATGEPVTEFLEPVKITIHYNPDDLVGIVEETLQLFYWDEVGEAWVDANCQGEYTRNLAENWFSLHICHLSEFAVMGELWVNTPPVAQDQTVQTTENVAVAITLTATDADSDPLTYEVVTNPLHGGLTGTAPNLTYTPGTDYTGSDSFTFKANDGTDYSNVATVTINVVANQAPIADAGEDQTVNRLSMVTLDGSGSSDPDSHLPLTYLWTQPGGTAVTLSDPTGENPTFTAPNIPATLTFSLVVTDNLGKASAADEVVITVVNHAPVAQDQTVQTTQDVAVAIILTATDADSDPLIYEVVTNPLHGSLTGTAPNMTYTPSADYIGSDSFTFKANDGIDDSNIATVTINVVELTELPAITSEDHTTFTVGINGSFTFTATGIPTPVINLTGSLPDGLTFTSGTGTATLTGIPAAGSARTYVLTVTANNDVLPNYVQEFTLTVNTPPVADAGPDQTVASSSLVTLDGSGSTDPDGDTPLTYLWTQTGGLTVTLSSTAAVKPTFTAPAAASTLTFSLVITDGLGAESAPDTVVITVEDQAPTFQIFLPLILR